MAARPSNRTYNLGKSLGHRVFPGGHPSEYKHDSTLLNFSDRTRTAAFNVIWP